MTDLSREAFFDMMLEWAKLPTKKAHIWIAKSEVAEWAKEAGYASVEEFLAAMRENPDVTILGDE